MIGFTQVGTDVSVRIHNPNPSVGLVRSGYELTLLDSSGSVIATQGQGGVAGTVLNTVYQLPPNADYGITADAPAGKKVDSVELTILGKWHDWGSINAPGVSVTSPSIKDPTSTYGPTVVGRLSLQGGSPANVMVQSFVSTPAGSVVSSVVVDCVRNGEPRSFEAMSFAKTAGPFTVEKTVAYPTSVDGVEPSYPARC
ncbi:hypothetical protein AXK61_06515 [Tsukamurella pseudospumae]|uniref:Uncharacterized protein n=1 Tax=Tsukamurella pseudospumae TaxID=239498 RepID=A0A137YZ84_9ACTN|nr:hypothetical protein AXK61_06515 [Tsukamurella pseudospumae]